MEQNIAVVSVNKRLLVLALSFAYPIISPVFDLKKIRDEAISRTRLHEVPLSCLEIVSVFTSKFIDKVFTKTLVRVLLNLMKGDSVQDWFDETTVVTQANNLIWSTPQVDVLFGPDLFEYMQQLCRHQLLSEVITTLDNR